MIEANELRIGNWVYVGDLNGQINQCSFYDTYDFDPIPITEEWLLKFGFIKIAPEKWQHNSGHYIVINQGFVYRVPGVSLIRIEFIHQLQNLYFALRGQELTLCK